MNAVHPLELGDGEVVAAVRELLEGLDDPLYRLPIEFVFNPE